MFIHLLIYVLNVFFYQSQQDQRCYDYGYAEIKRSAKALPNFATHPCWHKRNTKGLPTSDL